jgi:hypothetical protein
MPPTSSRLVASATSLDDGKAKLAAYREKRGAVVTAFEAAYHAIAIAVLLKDDPTSLAAATKAAGELADAIAAITGGKSP